MARWSVASCLRTLALAGVLAAGTSRAVAAPVERRIEIAPGRSERTIPLSEPVRLHLEGAPTLSVTQDASDRLHIVAGEVPAAARLILTSDRILRAFSIFVGTAPEPPGDAEITAARKACPGLTWDGQKLHAQVQNEACVRALLPVTARLTEADLDLVYSAEGLRAQLAIFERARARIPGAEGIELAFLGYQLLPRGTLPDRETLDRLLVAFFDQSAGPLRVDLSRVEILKR